MKKLKLNDFIILVNKYDEVIGYEEKMYVHMNNMLHRAFSVFIFDWNTRNCFFRKELMENTTLEDCGQMLVVLTHAWEKLWRIV